MSQFIQDFRSKNPQYSDIPDDKLVSALHNKFYSDIPIEQFSQKIGYQPSQVDAGQVIQNDPVNQPIAIDGYSGPATNIQPSQTKTDNQIIDSNQQMKPYEPSLGQSLVDKWHSIFGIADRQKARSANDYAIEQTGISQEDARSSVGGMSEAPSQFSSKFIHGATFGVIPDTSGTPRTTSGVVASGGGELAGFIAGPAKVAEKVLGEKVLGRLASAPSDRLAMRLVKRAASGASVLGVASGLSDTGKAIDQPDITSGLKSELSSIWHGAGMGATFGVVGEAIPKKSVSQFLARTAANTAAIDAQSGKTPFSDIPNWNKLDQKQKAEVVFNYLLNGFFSIKGGTLNEHASILKKELNKNIDNAQFKDTPDMQARAALTPEIEQIKQMPANEKSVGQMVKEKLFDRGIDLRANIPVKPTNAEIPTPDSAKIQLPKEILSNKNDSQTKQKIVGKEIIETPISEIKLSNDIPQFKEGANSKGVVEPLGGKFERTGVAPIQIWVRKNGTKEVISGRHRLDLAERSGEKTIPSQYHYENKGFGADQAAALDAMLNIREGQGKVKDYVDFIKATSPSKAEADAQGILARQTGKRAYTIANEGSDALIASHRNNQLSDESATRIAKAAPRDEKLQAVGIKAIQDGKTIAVAENMVKAVKSMVSNKPKDSGDLFGFDDSAMIEAEKLAKSAVKKQNEIQRTLSAVQGAAKRPELAAKEGIEVKDPVALNDRINKLKAKKREWQNWHTSPKLVAELKGEDFKLTAETEAEIQAREKKEKDALTKESKVAPEVDNSEFVLSGSDRSADVAMSQGQEDIFSPSTGQVGDKKPAITRRQVMELNYSNGIKEVAKKLGVDMTPHESASILREKIISKLGLNPNLKVIENDTRGKGVQYHGTSSDLGKLSDNFYTTMNIYGQGLYTTDAMDIASGYTKKGSGNIPNIYKVDKKRKLNLFDMEKPLTDEIKIILKNADSDYYESISNETSNLREYYDERRLANEFESSDEIQGVFDSIASELTNAGYDGLKHIGGIKTNNKYHNVEIYFKPRKDVSLVKADRPLEITKKTKPMSEVVDSAGGKKLTDADKVPAKNVSYDSEPIAAFNSFHDSIINQTATVEKIIEDANSIIANKEKIIEQLGQRKVTKAMLQSIVRSPRTDLNKSQLVKQAYSEMLRSHALGDGVITIFGGSKSFEEQIISKIKSQTKEDINNAYEKQRKYRAERKREKEGFVKALTKPETLAEFKQFIQVSGKEKLTSDQLKSYDGLVSSSLRQEDKPSGNKSTISKMVYNSGTDSPMGNFQPMYKTIGMPKRPVDGKVSLGDKTINLTPEDSPTRREGIQVQVEGIIGPRIYNSKIKGKSVLGFYNESNSAVRIKNYYDVEVLSHEMAHYLDMHYEFKKRFNLAYKGGDYKNEVEGLSYTSKKELVDTEGFAEFVRLWLTQYNEALSRAPKFTKKFELELSKDPKLNRKMKSLQANMHRWFYQGDLARLFAVTSGNQYSAKERMTKLTMQRPEELLRQKYIDNIHAAKVMTRETQGKLGDAGSDPYKQLQLINGIRDIFEESMKVGAPSLRSDGDIEFVGPSLKNIWSKSIRSGAKRIREQEVYFLAMSAIELKAQGRENLIDEGMIKEGLALSKKYPYFAESFKKYQEYNKNMMKFYVDTGYLEASAAKAMRSKRKSYVPNHRVTEGVTDGYSGAGGEGFKRLKGGTQNVKHVYDNIIMQDSKHIQAALKAKALRDLYVQALNSQDGSKFLSRIPADIVPNKVPFEQMIQKVVKAVDELGIDIVDKNGNSITTESEITKYFENNKEELMFWSFGNTPKTIETMVDSFIDGSGKRVWIEINKDNKLLPDMLDSLDGFELPKGVAGTALKFAMKVKQIQTLTITSMMQFAGPNIIRDQQQAFLLSGGKFKPVYDPIIGLGHILHSLVSKNSLVSEMKAQGGPGGGRVRTFLENEWGFADKKDYAHDKPFYHPKQIAKDLLDIYVSIMDSAEMSTRIGFYARLRKEGVSARDSAWQAREISTDFNKHGSYSAFVLLQRTVPFFGAYVQSVDRDIRGIADKNGEIKFSNLVKTESGRASLSDLKVKIAAIGGMYIAIHIALSLLGNDEEKYRELTPDQKARFYHYFINGKHHTIPKPHGLITLMGSVAESITDTVKGQSKKDAYNNILFALSYHLGADAMPGVINPVVEIALNRTFTGAPIVSKGAEKRSAKYQYSDRTPQLYVKAGELLGQSPDNIRHAVKGYIGYVEDIIAETTEEYLWDYEAWGERPNIRTFAEMATKQFNPREVPYRTKYTVGYYDLKKRSAMVEANLSFAKKAIIRDKSLIDEVLSGKLERNLYSLNKMFSKIDKHLGNQQQIIASFMYNKNLKADAKIKGIEDWYKHKNILLKEVYIEANKVINQSEKLVKRISIKEGK